MPSVGNVSKKSIFMDTFPTLGHGLDMKKGDRGAGGQGGRTIIKAGRDVFYINTGRDDLFKNLRDMH